MKHALLLSVSALLVVAIAGAQVMAGPVRAQDDSTPTPPAPDLAAIAASYPRVDGSTSALPMQVMIACVLLDVPCEWMEDPLFGFGPIGEGGTRRIMPVWDYFNMDNQEEPTEAMLFLMNMAHNGTHGSYVNLINGDTDLILVARVPSHDELAAAEEAGVTLDVRPVALDAFVFLVNVDNPVDSLPLETIRAIYTGEITHWAAISDALPPGTTQTDVIAAYQRNENSGSQELMEALVMQGAPMMPTAGDMILPGMMGPINEISWNPLGIGYSVFFYAANVFPAEQIKLLGVDGVIPTPETIASREYPLATEVFVVVRDDMPADSTAVQLRDWLLTPDGQAAIQASGYVPLEGVAPAVPQIG